MYAHVGTDTLHSSTHTHQLSHLLEQLWEVVDVGGLVELCLVPLLVQLVLGHVGSDHLQTVEGASA